MLKLEANALLGERALSRFKLKGITGVRPVTVRELAKAGLDTIDKIAVCNAENIREILADVIDKTGFKGVVPTAGEAQNTVSMARCLKRKVLY